MKLKGILFLLLISCSSLLKGQTESPYTYQVFVNNEGTLKYRMLMPKDFSEEKQYPVVLFLHGAGERGSDNERQLVHGSKLFVSEENRENFPAIIIFPQCPKDSYWSNATVNRSTKPITLDYPLGKPPKEPLSLVMQLMEDYLNKPYVDKNKIYVGGLSMGGMGTFEILYRRPDMFAAAFAICGGGNPDSTKEYATKTELWVFHGAKDDVVNPQLSIDMVRGYLKYGGKPNFTLYADDNHNSWDSAFAEPELLPWLFSKTKK